MPSFGGALPGEDIPLFAGQFEFNGLTLGQDTAYRVSKVDGLDSPDARVDETARSEAHGSFLYAPFMDSRRIVIEGNIVGNAQNGDLQALKDDLKSAFSTRTGVVPFRFYELGGITRRVYCIPTRRAWTLDTATAMGVLHYVLELRAGDPLIYEDGVNNLVAEAPVANGYSFPYQFPYSFGGGQSGSGTADNTGIEPTKPFIRIDGPGTNPEVTNVTQEKSVKVLLTLAIGDYLELDFDQRSVKLNGTASRYGNIEPGSQWWDLQPGENLVQFNIENAAGGTQMTMTWRSAWS